ncbi:MAG TPA: hypothetical protein VGO52_19855 [Hyphomonadaceae bacterium]|jgi:hypothetical protein|nr:hypothetical protein [Hyphomonadaceae bacterium]
MNHDDLMAREALDLRLRLEFGLASLEEIELWADAWLLAFDKPRDELVDLAFAQRMGPDTSFTLLRTLGVAEPQPADILRVVGQFAGAGLSAPQLEKLARHVQRWALPASEVEDSPAGRLLLESLNLVDAFYLADAGHWGALDKACALTRRFLDEARLFNAATRGGA